jgi:hypothetical protein
MEGVLLINNSLSEVKFDGAVQNVECEGAIGTFVDFPSVVLLLQ